MQVVGFNDNSTSLFELGSLWEMCLLSQTTRY